MGPLRSGPMCGTDELGGLHIRKLPTKEMILFLLFLPKPLSFIAEVLSYPLEARMFPSLNSFRKKPDQT